MAEQPDFQPIGGLMRKVLPSPPSLDSTPPTPPTASAITGSPSPAKRESSWTGTPPGAIGAAPKAIDAKLLRLAPKEVDRHLEALLPPQVRLCLRPVTRTSFDEQYGFQSRLTGYRIAPDAQADPVLVERALGLLARACAPAPKDVIVAELTALRFLTKARAEHQDDLKFRLAVYAEKLSDYPGDVVLHVLKTQADHCPFWPAWDELRDRLDLHGKKRMALFQALKEWAAFLSSSS